MNKIRIAIERIIAVKEYTTLINEIPLDMIIWTKNGKDVDFDKKIIEDFELTGLSNIDFITSNYL